MSKIEKLNDTKISGDLILKNLTREKISKTPYYIYKFDLWFGTLLIQNKMRCIHYNVEKLGERIVGEAIHKLQKNMIRNIKTYTKEDLDKYRR